jgi:flagellar basal body-associated protein FliL
MAEKNENQQKRSVSPLMTILALAVVLLAQVGVVGGAYWLWGGPSQVKADSAAADEAAKAQQPTEVLVVADRFQNTRSGRTYLYDTEIYIVTENQHEEHAKERFEKRRAQVVTEIATIIRRDEPSYFKEPELSTLTRQVRAALNEVLGKTEEGETYIDKVLIKKMLKYDA